jgi:hypothetical protein
MGVWLLHAACGKDVPADDAGDGNPSDFNTSATLTRSVQATVSGGDPTPATVACDVTVAGQECGEPVFLFDDDSGASCYFVVDAATPLYDGGTVSLHCEGTTPANASIDADATFENFISTFGAGDEAFVFEGDVVEVGDVDLFDVDFGLAVFVGEDDVAPDDVPLDGAEVIVDIPASASLAVLTGVTANVASAAPAQPFTATWILSWSAFDGDERCDDDHDCGAATPYCVAGSRTCDTGDDGADCADPHDCDAGLVCGTGGCGDPATRTFCASEYECDYGCIGGFCRHGTLGEDCLPDPGCVSPLVCTDGFCAQP